MLYRCKDLALENEELSNDIDELEQLLASHASSKVDRSKNEQGYVDCVSETKLKKISIKGDLVL